MIYSAEQPPRDTEAFEGGLNLERGDSRPPKQGKTLRGGALPPLRALEVHQFVIPAEASENGEEQPVFLLQDPEGVMAEQTVLSPAAFALASLFDGERTAREVSAEFKRRFEEEVPEEAIEKLAADLTDSLALAGPKFERKIQRLLLKYLGSEVRPPVCAGKSYAEDPEEMRRGIEAFYEAPESPSPPAATPPREHLVHAVVAPHIELRVGRASYAHAYKALAEGSQADLFIVLGVAHKATPPNPFFVSQKDYAVPGGKVKTAREPAAKLQKAANTDETTAELAHRLEHSIEFPAVILKTLLTARAGRDFEIVPILCGPVEPFFRKEGGPLADDDFRRFVETLREELDKSGRKWSLIASVDFSHVGPKFEASTPIDERVLWRVERNDRRLLKLVERQDGASFYEGVRQRENATNIDGVLPLLTMLEVCRGVVSAGELLHFGRMFERETASAVTFAAMSFTGESPASSR